MEHCCVCPSPSPCSNIHPCYSRCRPVLTAGGRGPCGQALQFGALQVGLPRADLDGCLVSTDTQEWNLGVTVDPRGSSGLRMCFLGRGGGRCGRGLWSVLPASLPVAPVTAPQTRRFKTAGMTLCGIQVSAGPRPPQPPLAPGAASSRARGHVTPTSASHLVTACSACVSVSLLGALVVGFRAHPEAPPF